ncbi:potassium channel family protein [Psychrobacillus sp. FSL W7-1493]|uniref:potassium channel family protein n=1 Tax=Psychrobacillus sp. FSL W7-1493 TaxID=2921552 RepID=UPI0030FC6957
MFSTILMGLTILFMVTTLYYFFSGHKYKKSYFQSTLFQKLFFAMLGITFGFAVLYYLLSMEGDVVRVSTEEGKDGGENFLDYLYFSGVTILSVGYGDLVPVGKARFFALIQAAIGLLLPTAFFIRALDEKEGSSGDGAKNENEDEQGSDNDGQTGN